MYICIYGTVSSKDSLGGQLCTRLHPQQTYGCILALSAIPLTARILQNAYKTTCKLVACAAGLHLTILKLEEKIREQIHEAIYLYERVSIYDIDISGTKIAIFVRIVFFINTDSYSTSCSF